MTSPYPDSLDEEKQLSEANLNTLEWALSFLHWYEKKYQKKHYLHPLEENISDEH